MAMKTPSAGRRGRIASATVAEINVTPLVDVMLVLLVIFMTASAVETTRVSREAETLRQVISDEQTDSSIQRERQIPLELPKAEAERMGTGKAVKPVLSMDAKRRIYFNATLLMDCGRQGGALATCLDKLEDALSAHGPAKGIREVHLRADRKLGYGEVLQLMARLRRAGITQFGLVSEALASGPSKP